MKLLKASRASVSVLSPTLVFVFFAAPGFLEASEISDNALINYTSGMTLSADDLNNNFDEIKNAVNDNALNIGIKQDRVGGACANGAAISSIAANGTVTCETIVGGGSGDGHSLDSSDGSIVDALFIQDNGNVGIGVTSTGNNSRLHVKRTNTGEIARLEAVNCGWIRFTDASADRGSIGVGGDACMLLGQLPDSLAIKVPNALHLNVGADVANGITLNSVGNVGIGLTNPVHKLHVNGDVGATSFVNLSDERLKTDIKSITNATDKIAQLRGVSFKWKKEVKQSPDNLDEMQFGFIAQEVEKVMPEVVTARENNYAGVSYVSLIPLLVESIKEQKKKIEKLEKTIRDLSANLPKQ